MRICFFGDSFVNGTGDDDCLGWVGRLCAGERRAEHDLTVYNLGVRRDTSADVRARWRREAEARLPEGCGRRLVFSFGANDCALEDDDTGPRIAAEATMANAAAILGEAKRWLPTLMVGPPPVAAEAERNAEIVRISEGIARVCADLGIPFISAATLAPAFYAKWRAEAEAQAGDGIHPNRAGYAALAEAIGRSGVWKAWLAL